MRNPLLFPIIRADMRAEKPADTCTTFPPAKSRTPALLRKPLGCQVEWAIGQYTIRCHKPVEVSKEINFILSANAPQIREGVITAKDSSNTQKSGSGMVGAN